MQNFYCTNFVILYIRYSPRRYCQPALLKAVLTKRPAVMVSNNYVYCMVK